MTTSSLLAAVAFAQPAIGHAPTDLSTPGGAQDQNPPRTTVRRAIDGTTLGGFVLPTKPLSAGCSLSASRGWAWKSDDTQRLLLEGDVRVSLGGYSFSARRAAVWINRLPLATGAATQIAIWFERADEPTRRAGLGASGRDLLVTSSYLGETALSLVMREDEAPRDRAFTAAAERRLALYLRTLVRDIEVGAKPLGNQPEFDMAPRVPEADPQPGGSVAESVAALPIPPASIDVSPSAQSSLPIFRPEGTVAFSADSIVIDEPNNRVAVQGMVELEYLSSAGGSDRALQLSAERGVIFLAPGTIAMLRSGERNLDAASIDGIYLEGAVQASDGDYALRGSQVYYDLARNRAVILDAVLRTYDRRRRDLPIYTRAAELRQIAADQWVAERATVSTSEFFTPHLAIGVDRVTVTQRLDDEASGTGGGFYANAEGAGLEVGGRRLLPLPAIKVVLIAFPSARSRSDTKTSAALRSRPTGISSHSRGTNQSTASTANSPLMRSPTEVPRSAQPSRSRADSATAPSTSTASTTPAAPIEPVRVAASTSMQACAARSTQSGSSRFRVRSHCRRNLPSSPTRRSRACGARTISKHAPSMRRACT